MKAGDTILVHVVRLLMEKIGPRAVVVQTDLRNAYNEISRASIFSTLMSRPCLAGAVHPFRAAMSTEAFLVVGGRANLVASSEGVQQGDPLSTGAFCQAIHEYVRQADATLAAKGGACRFFADDGCLVGLPEDVWPVLARLTEDLRRHTGLEMQLSKVEAYSADLHGARAGAPEGIQWPTLDGHHGMSLLNVPVCGSPEYVAAYLRRKAEDVGASIRTVVDKLTGQTSEGRQLHHHAWAMLQHSLQHKAVYWLRNCLPCEVGSFADEVDAAVRRAVEQVLQLSFDVASYPEAVMDDTAAREHNWAAPGAGLPITTTDSIERAQARLHLPAVAKGGGIRLAARTVDAAFVGALNDVLPRFLEEPGKGEDIPPLPGFYKAQLEDIFGDGSFHPENIATRYQQFLTRADGGCRMAAELHSAWSRMQAATTERVPDADNLLLLPVAAARGTQRELTRLIEQAAAIPVAAKFAALPNAHRDSLFSQINPSSWQWVTALPIGTNTMNPSQLREVAATYFLLPSPLLRPLQGRALSVRTLQGDAILCDGYGDNLLNARLPGRDCQWSRGHSELQATLATSIHKLLGLHVDVEVRGQFQNLVPPERQLEAELHQLEGIVPDIGTYVAQFDEEGQFTGSAYTHLELKTIRRSTNYRQWMQTGGMAVDRRTAQLAKAARDKLSRKEQEWCGTAPGDTGPMTGYFDSVPYTGLAWGPLGETSKGVVETVRGVAQLAARRANHFVGPGPISKTIEAQAARVQRAMLRDLGVVAVRANADLLIARRRHVCGVSPGGGGGEAAVLGDRARLS